MLAFTRETRTGLSNPTFISQAPGEIEFTDVSTTEVTVEATPPSGNPAIDSYEISVVGATPPAGNPDIDSYEAVVDGSSPPQKCTVKASTSPLQCEITGLTPNTEYTISMHACLPLAAGCGEGASKDTKTLPNRKSNGLKMSV